MGAGGGPGSAEQRTQAADYTLQYLKLNGLDLARRMAPRSLLEQQLPFATVRWGSAVYGLSCDDTIDLYNVDAK